MDAGFTFSFLGGDEGEDEDEDEDEEDEMKMMMRRGHTRWPHGGYLRRTSWKT